MSNVFPFYGQFPLTAPDIAIAATAAGGLSVDANAIMTETLSELQNLQQDLTNRLIEIPGSNLDFGVPNIRGIGLMRYLSGTSDDLATLPAKIEAEFIQDSRVVGCAAQIITNPDGTFLISVEVETVAGVFGLSWAWSQTGVIPLPLTVN
jgi:hypothetical protein